VEAFRVTTGFAVQSFQGLPFVPFEMYLVDGRVIRVPHQDFASLEEFAVAVSVFDDDGRAEVIDVAMIVSFRTLNPI
jgi:hypothetical protein